MYECTQNILAIWGNYDSVVYGRGLTAFHKMTSVELFYRALAGDGGSRAAHVTSRFSLLMLAGNASETGTRVLAENFAAVAAIFWFALAWVRFVADEFQ
jgi:hypothetical protein